MGYNQVIPSPVAVSKGLLFKLWSVGVAGSFYAMVKRLEVLCLVYAL